MQAVPPRPIPSRPSEGVTDSQTSATPAAAKTVSLGQRSLWCCSFCVMPLFIPMLIYVVKDSDMLRRIFLGLFTALIFIKLICFSIAMFHTRTHRAIIARRNSDDDRFSRRAFAAPTRLLHHGSNQPQNSSSSRPTPSSLPTRFNSPGQPSTNSRSFSIGLHAPMGDSSRGNQFVVDDPPPYHLALTLPLPQEHTINIRERAETPPPSYEKILA